MSSRFSPLTANTKTAEQLNQESIDSIRDLLGRVMIVLNNKGGAGKTTTTANLAAQLAAELERQGSARRVLAVDLDPQGNLGLDLGYQGKAGDDAGASVIAVVAGLGTLNVVREVRPNLDVVPGGQRLNAITATIFASQQGHPNRNPMLSLAQALAEVAAEYEWVFIDCPPNMPDLQHLAGIAGRYVLIPVCFDQGSIQGLEGVASVFDAAGRYNDTLTPLGVVLFGFDRNNIRKIKDHEGNEIGLREVGVLAETRREILELIDRSGLDMPVFQTVITRAVSVAKLCRKRGRVFAEVADATAGADWKKMARQNKVTVSADSAETSALEMEELTVEVITEALSIEREMQG